MLSKLYEDNNWSCTKCKNINKGERNRCNNCNEFKPTEIEEELKTAKQDAGEGGAQDMMDNHPDMGGQMEQEYHGDSGRFGGPQSRPPMARGRGGGFGGGNHRGGSGGFGGRGGKDMRGGSRGGRGGQNNRFPMQRGGRGGGYHNGGGRYNPGGYESDMGPDGPYMQDFGGRNAGPRNMGRGGGNRHGGFPPAGGAPHRGGRSHYMDEGGYDDEMGNAGAGAPGGRPGSNYNESFRDRSRSQEKNEGNAMN